MSNKIVEENQKTGNPQSEWDLSGKGSTNIEGYATEMSVNLGQTVSFKINTTSSDYRIDIYRLGYYDGDGARKVGSIDHNSPTAVIQPAPLTDPSTGLIDAGNWSVTDTWTVPEDLVSGVYIAKLVREDGTFGENHIPFVVRDDDGQSDIVFKTADETWQAYNPWGGNNYYEGGDYAVSYNRPFTTRDGGLAAGPWDFVFGAEYSGIRWLEANGYDVSYIAGLDTARMGSELLEHKAFISAGHDEYWSGEQRANVEAARDAGVNLVFWSGNEVFWKTRWENSIAGPETAYRTLVSYKEGAPTRPDDPSDVWTGAWRDPASCITCGCCFSGMPENSLTGTIYQVDATPLQAIEIPYELSKLRFWDNTSVEDLQPGETASLNHYLGYEWDDDLDNGHRPTGLVPLSKTVIDVEKYLQPDFTNAPGTSTHSLTLYRAESGALVFGAGTVFWTWGLDSHHDKGPFGEDNIPADPRVQQAMINLFAEMGIQPDTLQAGLIRASQSTDHTAPASAVNVTFADMTVATGQVATISGTATDTGGGIIAVVEVSTDSGETWHRATGFENWTYSWTVPFQTGNHQILTRAVDDTINIETPGAGIVIKAVGFDARAYLSANLDVKAEGIDPYQHYLQYGWQEGRDPSAQFDTELYLEHNKDVAEAGLNPLLHYIEHGQAEGRPTYSAVGGAIEADGFDREYYLLVNKDVGEAGVDPYQHYLQDGWREGRNPNAYFDTKGYLAIYTDVADAGINPLDHYNEYGWLEGRDPSAKFDTKGYMNVYTDVAAEQIDPLKHYLEWGVYELRPAINDGQFS